MASAAHLTKRLVTSLWPLGPSASNDAWARSHLTEGEVALWKRMSRQDRRHSVGVCLLYTSDAADE